MFPPLLFTAKAVTYLFLGYVVDPIQQLAVSADHLCHHTVALGKLCRSAGDPLGLFLQLVDVDDGQLCLDQPLTQLHILGVDGDAALGDQHIHILAGGGNTGHFIGDNRQFLINSGEKYSDFQWKSVPATAYLAYERTGERTVMEAPLRENRAALTSLMFAELAEKSRIRFEPYRKTYAEKYKKEINYPLKNVEIFATWNNSEAVFVSVCHKSCHNPSK